MDREFDFFHQIGQFQVPWTGVVEDRNDPAFMGRVRVRIFGVHSTDRTEIPTETLPWATPLFPATAASFGGIGATAPGMIEGTWVMGFFRDGFSCQDPVIIGALLSSSSPKWTGTENVLKQNNIYNKTASDVEQNSVPTNKDLADIQTQSFTNKLQGFSSELTKKSTEFTKEVLDALGIKSMDGFKDHKLETEEFEEQIQEVSESVATKLVEQMEQEVKDHYKISTMDAATKETLKTEIKDETEKSLKDMVIEYQKR
jgi:hypothetical protein